MVYYTGLGHLAIIVFIVAMLPLCGLAFSMGFAGKGCDSNMVFLTMAGGAGLVVFILGRYLNRHPLELVELHGQGKVVVKKTRHTLSSLPMEYWGPLIFSLFACVGTYQSLPIFIKGSPVPQTISVSDLASKGPGNNINVQLSDFQFGSKVLEMRSKGNSEGATAYLPVFPKGQADGVQAPMVVAYQFVKDKEALKTLTRQSTITGVVVNGIKDVTAVQQAMAWKYPGVAPKSLVMVDLGQQWPSKYDAYLSPILAIAGVAFVFWLRKKDATRWTVQR